MGRVIPVLCTLVLLGFQACSATNVAFSHGVASGDPLPDACIIWTRVDPTGKTSKSKYAVDWEVATSDDFKHVKRSGTYATTAERDYTVKVDVTGLKAGVQYYYRFTAESVESPVGTFRLQPGKGAELEELHYGVYTCSSFGWGYFNAYAHGATLDFDFWIHVGDYIYEYGIDTYPSEEEAARPGLLPTTEIVSLDDYRTRYATYRSDAALQALHASAPLISIWDDHELTNNPWVGGAQNHQPETEGSWEVRKEVAVRAYHEWMPTRSGEYGTPGYIGPAINRRFDMGDLVTIQALETRITARTEQEPPELADVFAETDGSISGAISAVVGLTPPSEWTREQKNQLQRIERQSDRLRGKPGREMIGEEQLAQLEDAAGSDAAWLMVVQTTNMHDIFLDFHNAPKLVSGDLAELWTESIANITTPGATLASTSPTCYLRDQLGEVTEIDEDTARIAISTIATGLAEIVTGYDSWQGYTAERDRLYSALEPAGGNAIIYSGDTHAAYAGMIPGESDFVGAEFSSAGTTSTSYEAGALLPLDLFNAAMVTGNNVWMDTRYKGFQRVTLTKEKHHVDFVNLDYCSNEYKSPEPSCDYAFDLYAAGVTPAPRPAGDVGSDDGVPVDTLEKELAERKSDDLPDRADYPTTRSSLKVVPCYDPSAPAPGVSTGGAGSGKSGKKYHKAGKKPHGKKHGKESHKHKE